MRRFGERGYAVPGIAAASLRGDDVTALVAATNIVVRCAWCTRFRIFGAWRPSSAVPAEDALVSHGICPGCREHVLRESPGAESEARAS